MLILRAQGTARCLRGERPGALLFGYFLLGLTRESTPPAGRDPHLAFQTAR